MFTVGGDGVSSAPNHDQRARGYPDLVPLLANPIPQTTGRRSVWINGRLHSDGEAPTVSATDHGLVVGDGVFEALKVTGYGAFAIRRHLARLTRSAAALGLPAPDHDRLREAIDAVLADRDFTDGKLRITYTGGAGPLGSQPAYGPPTLIVAAETSAPSARDHRRRHGAVEPQRARRAGRSEVHLVRGERPRSGLGGRAWRGRSRSFSTRPGTCARAPVPTSSACSATPS